MKARAKVVTVEITHQEALEILAFMRTHPDKVKTITDKEDGAGKLHMLLQAQFESQVTGVHHL